MKVIDTKINGVKIIEPKVFEDVRGFFLETFNAQRYKKMLDIEHDFIQDNHSRSVKNVLRGLHLQTNNPQGKLVRVVHG
ncbi:dTDP-4-dehydrorhamnose 3,5-epimerase, partial [Citrobacter freundii]